MSTRTNTASWVESRNRWQIKVQKDGERKMFVSSLPGRNGQREANRKADTWLDDGIVNENQRVNDLFAEFEKSIVASASTTDIRQVKTMGSVWILPAIGSKKISALCDQDIQDIYDAANAKGRSRATIRDIRAVANRFFKWCRRKKYSTFWPEDTHIPQGARLKGKRIVQPADFIKFFNIDTYEYYGKRVKEPYILAYRFAILTGMRPGEMRGLKKSDCHGSRIYIKGAINSYDEHTQGKNDNAIRKVQLSALAQQVLETQLQQGTGEYVFDMPADEVYRKHLKRFCEDNNISYVSPYELRHTFVSAVKQLPEGLVKELVGHSRNMDTFGTYGHALDGEDEETSIAIIDVFERLIAANKI